MKDLPGETTEQEEHDPLTLNVSSLPVCIGGEGMWKGGGVRRDGLLNPEIEQKRRRETPDCYQ